jgi:hypothetical protein
MEFGVEAHDAFKAANPGFNSETQIEYVACESRTIEKRWEEPDPANPGHMKQMRVVAHFTEWVGGGNGRVLLAYAPAINTVFINNIHRR